MRKLLAAVLLVSILISGCGSTKSIIIRKVEFTAPDNTFSATFPEKPSHRTETSYMNGTGYSMEIYESEGFTRYLSISYGNRTELFDKEKSIDAVMEGLLNSFAESKDIEVLSKSEIYLNDYKGMECIMSTQKDAGRLILRIFITEKRVYYIIAEDVKDKIDSEPVKEFLESFVILKEP